MSAWLDAAIAQMPAAVLGVTAILAVGLGAQAVARGPVLRQRLGEWALQVAALWLVATVVPLPRLPRAPTAAQEARLAGSVPGAVAAAVPAIVGPAQSPAPTAGLFDAAPPAAPPAALPVGRRAAEVTRAVVVEPAAAPPSWSLATALAAVQVLGGGALALWLLLGALAVRAALRASRPATGALAALFEALRAGGHPRVALRVSPRASRPFVYGGRRPTIVLPAPVAADLAVARAVLLHELAHVARGDHAARLRLALCTPLLGLHPLFWLLRRRAWFAAELIADELAALRCGRSEYARRLLGLADALSPAPRAHRLDAAGALGVLGDETGVPRRIEMLLRRNRPLSMDSRAGRAARRALGVLLVAGSALSFGARLPAQESAAELAARNRQLQAQVEELRAQVAALGERLAAQAPRTDPRGAVFRDADGDGLPDTRELPAVRMIDTDGDGLPDHAVAEPDTPRAAPAVAQPLLDTAGLMQLVSQAVDLDARIQGLAPRVERLEQLVKAATVSASELQETLVELAAARKKRELLGTVLRAEKHATAVELDHCRRLLDAQGDDEAKLATGQRIIRLEARLQVLEQVL
ncbi:MAG: M56 family metallopeptidase [Planctomycetes bacterium]|nr:M56 family metallopeptidase [Planctomycetota bacterium]